LNSGLVPFRVVWPAWKIAHEAVNPAGRRHRAARARNQRRAKDRGRRHLSVRSRDMKKTVEKAVKEAVRERVKEMLSEAGEQ
jgi:hypothetical protein